MEIFLNQSKTIPTIKDGIDIGPVFTGMFDISTQQDDSNVVYAYFRPGTASVAIHQATKTGPSETKVRTYEMYEGDNVFLCNTKVSQLAFFPHVHEKNNKPFYSVDISELSDGAKERIATPLPSSLSV